MQPEAINPIAGVIARRFGRVTQQARPRAKPRATTHYDGEGWTFIGRLLMWASRNN